MSEEFVGLLKLKYLCKFLFQLKSNGNSSTRYTSNTFKLLAKIIFVFRMLRSSHALFRSLAPQIRK